MNNIVQYCDTISTLAQNGSNIDVIKQVIYQLMTHIECSQEQHHTKQFNQMTPQQALSYQSPSPFLNQFESSPQPSSPSSNIDSPNDSGCESLSDDEREETSRILGSMYFRSVSNIESPIIPPTPPRVETNPFRQTISTPIKKKKSSKKPVRHSVSSSDLHVSKPQNRFPPRTLSESDVTKGYDQTKWKTGRVCGFCNATVTPEWRLGPNQISLCNACGLQYRYKLKQEKDKVNKAAIQNILN